KKRYVLPSMSVSTTTSLMPMRMSQVLTSSSTGIPAFLYSWSVKQRSGEGWQMTWTWLYSCRICAACRGVKGGLSSGGTFLSLKIASRMLRMEFNTTGMTHDTSCLFLFGFLFGFLYFLVIRSILQFFILHLFVKELIDLFDVRVRFNLAKLVDGDLEPFKFFVNSRFRLFLRFG